jgi:SAM-dependent methyltransferase
MTTTRVADLVGINVGCGPSPTDGYFNYDNSYSVRLARLPLALRILALAGFASERQLDLAAVARIKGIRWARAQRLPHLDNTVDVVYSSHMVEHLDRRGALEFLREVLRVLKPGGTVRLALPDLRLRVDSYLQDGNADRFVDRLYLAREHPRGLRQIMKGVIVGDRHHAWMYDARSAIQLLEDAGFQSTVSLVAGETTIPKPGLLDLLERQDDSIYVEGRAPAMTAHPTALNSRRANT